MGSALLVGISLYGIAIAGRNMIIWDRYCWQEYHYMRSLFLVGISLYWIVIAGRNIIVWDRHCW